MCAIQLTSKAFHSREGGGVGALPCFYLRAAVSSHSFRSSLRNPIKMTDCILSPQDLSFREIYKSVLIMLGKSRNMKLWSQHGCFTPSELPKRVTHRWMLLPMKELDSSFALLLTSSACFCIVCPIPTLLVSPESNQCTGGGSLAPVTRERACFTPRPLSSFTNSLPGQTIKGSRLARRNPVPWHKRGCTAWSLPSQCQEFNFTQLTSATDKWNINNARHTQARTNRTQRFDWMDVVLWHVP